MLVTPAERKPPTSFQRDRDPAYHGRFRLWFDQLTPFIDDHRAFVPVRPELEALAREASGALEPDQSWPIHLVRPAEEGADWAVEGGDPRLMKANPGDDALRSFAAEMQRRATRM